MADLAALAERIWFGKGLGARAARVALAPATAAYGGITRVRGALYDGGSLTSRALDVPAISIGNVTVGGTGKTPIAAWFAGRLQAAGARPAIVMRGYGDDEPLVHRVLTPGIDVVADADRVRGTAEAARRGADVVVLDDAFQHRQARRDVDVVLIAAERAGEPVRLLPSGPYREPLSALRRASVVVITRKSASDARVAEAMSSVARAAPSVPTTTVSLSLDALRAWSIDGPNAVCESLASLVGQRVLAVAAVGDPRAFFDQLSAVGAQLVPAPYADHHAFDAADVARLAERATSVDRVVCTLKDAVKLGPLWPRLASTLWYVSQRVTVQTGGDALNHIIARLLSARRRHHLPTGSGWPS